MNVETWPIEKLVPYTNNPRKITPRAIDAVAGSIREFGWRVPIVVDEAGTIIAGHTRLEAARKLGMTEVPVHVAIGLTRAQAKAFRLADNRSAEFSEWDSEKLRLELEDCDLGSLQDQDFAGLMESMGSYDLDESKESHEDKSVLASLIIPPMAWMESRDSIQSAFDRVASSLGVSIRWP